MWVSRFSVAFMVLGGWVLWVPGFLIVYGN
jgi:hypothetical protein